MKSLSSDIIVIIGQIALGLHLLGMLSAVQAIVTARTSQGAIAWAIGLISFPYASLPLYWIFGRDRFHGYKLARYSQDRKLKYLREQPSEPDPKSGGAPVRLLNDSVRVFETLANMPFTRDNSVDLCCNGEETFAAIFRAMAEAKHYLLIQFFIVHDDELGRLFKSNVIHAAKRGVRVYFLYDEVGSHGLPSAYIAELRASGVDIRPFKTTKGFMNRLQLNFRNHRKVVVADGSVGFVGGHNVGDEYLGKSKRFGPWRDTHVRLEGPVVFQVQTSFTEDWFWSSGEMPPLDWSLPVRSKELRPDLGVAALVLPTGPADPRDTCCLFFLQAINSATERIWLTSPYFVPDPQILSALQLAAMRGVDVRIILPRMADHILVYLASFSFLKEALPFNVKLYRYQTGFIHEKVLLIDNDFSAIGTANFDNRSFRLNFELTVIFASRPFCEKVEKMLKMDLSQSLPVTMDEIDRRPLLFKVGVQVARLMSPVL